MSGGGEDLENAAVVEDPTKSWVIYTALHEPGHVDYYRLDMRQGQNITLMLSVPTEEGEEGFAPDLVLMGPGLEDQGELPERVQRAEGGAVVLEGEVPPRPTYEPFSPSVFYELAEIRVDAPEDGTYYVAVYDDLAGNYSLAVGRRESFTVTEWLTIPLSLLGIYQWEGQEWWAIALPGALAFAGGLGLMTVDARRRRFRPDMFWLIVTVAGLLMIAAGATMAYQMAIKLLELGTLDATAVVTAVLAVVPMLLGVAALRVARRPPGKAGPLRTKGTLIAIGLLGLLAWAGWLLGPALIIAAAVLPRGWLDRPLW